MLPNWAQVAIAIAIIAIFISAVLSMAGSGYGDWVRDFHARRDKLTTLFGDKDSDKSKPD